MSHQLNTRCTFRWFTRTAQAATIAFTLRLPAYAETPDVALSSLGCRGCHAEKEGQENGQLSDLASLRRFAPGEIASRLRDYRDGKRSGTVMNRIAAGLKDGEIEEIAGLLGKRP
ncbi:c-type cytochrome [Methylococcus mesophilus]|uniref:c-type cytochrome n=1 Tax=Methylococcus mesophilus TaxID=2993564 RepID=UPI00224AE628|nr:cytochrome c family protein [Methylococcus mesophilus]UZR29133.1 cytochrome c family protein [Methylococcus mesophilus]